MEDFEFKQKISPEGDQFGASLSIDGNSAVIGANAEPQDGADGVFAYKLNGTWEFTDSFDHDTQNFRFGSAVALEGNTCIVGTTNDRAFVYITNDGVNWTLEQELIPSGNDDRFGVSVALSGDTCIIGQPNSPLVTTDKGSAYVFIRNAGVWTEQAQLKPQTEIDFAFGTAVGISDDTCIIGASDRGGQVAGDIGSAYVFTRSAGTWAEQQVLTPSDNGGFNPDQTAIQFGRSLSLDNNQCMIGAPGAWANSSGGGLARSGAVYYFRFNGAAWVEQQRIVPSPNDAANSDVFGLSVSLLDNRCVIGDLFFESAPSSNDGKVYTYINQGDWQLSQTFVSDFSDTLFGTSVGLGVTEDSETLMIGAGRENRGAVYVYEAPIIRSSSTESSSFSSESTSSTTQIFSSQSTLSESSLSTSLSSNSSSSTKILSSQSTSSTSTSSTSSSSSDSTGSTSSSSPSSNSSSGPQQGCIYKNLRKEYRALIPNKGNKYAWQPSDDMSFMMWFRGNNAQYHQHIGGLRNPGFRFYAKSIDGFSYLTAAFGNQEVVSRDKIENNTWYHLALIVEDQFMKFYINGEFIGPDIFFDSSSSTKLESSYSSFSTDSLSSLSTDSLSSDSLSSDSSPFESSSSSSDISSSTITSASSSSISDGIQSESSRSESSRSVSSRSVSSMSSESDSSASDEITFTPIPLNIPIHGAGCEQDWYRDHAISINGPTLMVNPEVWRDQLSLLLQPGDKIQSDDWNGPLTFKELSASPNLIPLIGANACGYTPQIINLPDLGITTSRVFLVWEESEAERDAIVGADLPESGWTNGANITILKANAGVSESSVSGSSISDSTVSQSSLSTEGALNIITLFRDSFTSAPGATVVPQGNGQYQVTLPAGVTNYTCEIIGGGGGGGGGGDGSGGIGADGGNGQTSFIDATVVATGGSGGDGAGGLNTIGGPGGSGGTFPAGFSVINGQNGQNGTGLSSGTGEGGPANNTTIVSGTGLDGDGGNGWGVGGGLGAIGAGGGGGQYGIGIVGYVGTFTARVGARGGGGTGAVSNNGLNGQHGIIIIAYNTP